MEAVTERYALLCQMQITHSGFAGPTDRTADWLRIEPTTSTEVLMRRNRLRLKYLASGFGILAQVQPGTSKPWFDLTDQLLSFRLKFASALAASRTALSTSHTHKYRFGNSKAKTAGLTTGALSLSLPTFSNAGTYQPGEIVKKGTKVQLAQPDYATTPPGLRWVEVPAADYVTTADAEPLTEDDSAGTYWGLLTITVSASLGTTYRLLHNHELTSPTFRLHLGQR
ncbi:hypothetical protein GCM10027275_03030 [Rhabdobacter roseus]|uniref:Uncharacterized protein YaiE (UPF0345 family) n=1 Tax=Rhabdobacter roseus TaxID=1655419 RepID=A0A840TG59_9BACT|nr:hypothetical protein [Rhabdobacter roseus]MBB5282191.1 uncharacterized protein YaiE (UPF0345 family) [Rhabdobacter roseus]